MTEQETEEVRGTMTEEETEAETEAETEVGTGTGLGIEAEIEAGTEVAIEAEIEARAETELETEVERGAETEVVIEAVKERETARRHPAPERPDERVDGTATVLPFLRTEQLERTRRRIRRGRRHTLTTLQPLGQIQWRHLCSECRTGHCLVIIQPMQEEAANGNNRTELHLFTLDLISQSE